MGPLSALQTSKVSTAIPLIADNAFAHFRVQTVSIDPATEKRPYPNLKIEARTVEATKNADGGAINPGFPLFISFPLGQKDQPDVPQDWVGRAIGQFQDCVLGTADAGNKKGKPERPDMTEETFPDYVGKDFWAKVTIQVDKTGEYPDKNQLKNFTFPGDLNA